VSAVFDFDIITEAQAERSSEMENICSCDILGRWSGIRHGTTMRNDAFPLEFSMALHTGQPRNEVVGNRKRLEKIFGPDAVYISVKQVHGDNIHTVESVENFGWLELDENIKADALVTSLPGVVLTILTADCVPILLYDPISEAIGVVYAGWRGTSLSILPKTVRLMRSRYGSRPEDIVAAIGPAIGGCCYEVDGEVAECFDRYGKALRRTENGKYMLDLKSVNADQLVYEGLRPERIEISPVCTSCENGRFFSYRKNPGCDGRFMSCIMLSD